ncbi:hypothetical protein EU803_09115 [Loktanella sp. IMCC34160]|uniref:hypothetical protein n=1 Tax=Loktanella sp. IMCC34160 TaxID=2510646 RepID=UPI00101D4939|nr:hypothetical protein [Loktanella sp. IMCC34160]RYG91248.1 hypothetical protein EU803_09115 [Loktanella sp. IMCC34160]
MTLGRAFQIAAFVIAVGYCLRMVFFSEYTQFAGPFRFFTVWGLFLATIAHGLTVFSRDPARWDGFIGAASVQNAMVVLLYWRLYFADPASVTANGQLGVWWLEFYLHAVGPHFLWINALFVYRGFRRPLRSIGWMVGIVTAYIAWAELLVQRFATEPSGTVTNGLPYPFLNNLEFAGRASFYGMNFVVALVFVAGFALIAALIRRSLPQARP